MKLKQLIKEELEEILVSKRVLVIDVESTCWKDKNEAPDKTPHGEIIEIGYALVDGDKITKRGTFIVKPEYSKVSEFCTQLTTLTQKQVDNGISFKAAIRSLPHADVWASWGFYDKSQMQRMFDLYNLNNELPKTHINVRELCAKKIFNSNNPQDAPNNPKDAMGKVGLTWKGVNHRGIDDAYNIALIFQKLNEKKSEKEEKKEKKN